MTAVPVCLVPQGPVQRLPTEDGQELALDLVPCELLKVSAASFPTRTRPGRLASSIWSTL